MPTSDPLAWLEELAARPNQCLRVDTRRGATYYWWFDQEGALRRRRVFDGRVGPVQRCPLANATSMIRHGECALRYRERVAPVPAVEAAEGDQSRSDRGVDWEELRR